MSSPPNSKQKIIDTALELFARHGYDGTSIKMIAHTAGVSQGLMYNYFASKSDLLRAIFQQGLADIDASFAQAATAPTPLEQLKQHICASFEIIRQNRKFWKLYHGLRLQAAVLEQLGEDVDEATQHISDRLQSYFVALDSPDPETDARLLFALIDGIAQHYILSPESYPLEAVLAKVINKFVPKEEDFSYD